MKITKTISILTLNVWFYFWAPFVLLISLLAFTPFVAFFRIFKPPRNIYYLRKSISLYGKSVIYTAWPWIRLKIHNIPDYINRTYVVVENHTSSLDPFVQAFLPFEFVQVAKGRALHFPILGFLGRLAGYIDVDSMLGEKLVENASELLKSGISVVFFPEGTRNKDKMGPFHSIAFRVAFENKKPVLPIIIKGIVDNSRKGSFIIRPGKIDIFCLEPIMPEEYKDKSYSALKKMVRKKMEDFLE